MIMNRYKISVLALITLCWAASGEERSISLQECIELSHTHNPSVVNASLDVQAARARKQEVFTNWFPTVSFTAGGFHSLDPLLSISLEDVLGSSDAANNILYYAGTMAGLTGIDTRWDQLQRGYLAFFNLQQPLFTGGRIAKGNELAALGVEASEVKSGMALRDNDDNITSKYWTAVSLSEKKKALQQGLDLVASLEKDVQAAVEAGIAKQSDLLQVKLQANELTTTMKKLVSGERLAKMDLFNSIGLEYSFLALDEMTLSDGFEDLLPPESYYKDAGSVVSSLSESRLLDMSVESKELEKKIVLGEALPQVAVGASLGYGQTIGEPRGNGLVYAIVSIPISDWSKTSRKLQRSQFELQKARNDSEYLQEQLLLKVNMEWIELQNAWNGAMDAQEAVSLSELLESQKREEYDAGMCTMTELLKAQSDLQGARSTYVDCALDYLNAVAVWNK